MGDTKEHTDEIGCPLIFGEREEFLKQLFGCREPLRSCFVYQLNVYSKYDVLEGPETLRAKRRDEQFSRDLQSAYELRKRLLEKTKTC